MDYNAKRCPNMNHGRKLSQVKFCPTCGEKLFVASFSRCDGAQHPARRKNRDHFCIDCGASLSSP